jgi:AraC-like DNA-binding protein
MFARRQLIVVVGGPPDGVALAQQRQHLHPQRADTICRRRRTSRPPAGSRHTPSLASCSGRRRNCREPIDWGDLAGGAGYFDQAHFGHEFRAFTGLTPTRYVEVRRRFLREHPGHVLDGWPLPAD